MEKMEYDIFLLKYYFFLVDKGEYFYISIVFIVCLICNNYLNSVC